MATSPDPAVRQRDYLLGIARAMTEALEPRDVMTLVLKTAVTMTGGTAGAIAIRGDGRLGAPEGGPSGGRAEADDDGLRIVASYHLEAKLVEHLQANLAGFGRGAAPHTAASAPAPPSTSPASFDPGSAPGGAPDPDADADAPLAAAADLVRVMAPAANFALPALPPPAGALVAVRTLPGDDEAMDVVTLPLRRREHAIGQIVVFRSQGAAVFASADDDVLRAFADQAAVAIENALLHARLTAREHQLAAVVEGSPTGILLLDPSGRIVGANTAAERLLAPRLGGLLGLAAADVLPLEGDDGRPITFDLGAAIAGAVDLTGRLGDGSRRPWLQIGIRSLEAADDTIGEVDAVGGASGGETDRAAAPEAEGFVVNIVDVTGLREAENAKNTFLAGLSHELKTPLALIRGFAETLRQPQMARDEAFKTQAVDVILEETTHLTRMVDQLLLAARLHAGALPLDWHTVDLRDLLGRAVDAFRRVHPDRRWHAELADVGPIVADPVRLKEVFDNLLSNAVKYSASDSPIAVVLTSDGPAGDVVAQVIDRGVGIRPADQAQLFGRFFRAQPDSGADGTGLGLYMARAIVGAHGGRIDVASAPGEGSTFTVRLPRRPAEAAAPEDDAALDRHPTVGGAFDGRPSAGAPPADRQERTP
ncbi:MAG: ATP-binding protein [Anaerolineae bacterium]